MKKALLLLLFFFYSALFADGLSTSSFNYINDLVGGRATGMGGAYTAISDDPAGLYYNPAGSVFAADNQISLSVNSYKAKKSSFKEVIGDNDYEQEVSSFFPSFFGVAQSFGAIKLGFSFVNINNEILDQDSYFNDLVVSENPATFTMNYNITENTLLIGPSLATFITDKISAGISVYGFRKTRQEISFQMVSVEDEGSTSYEINDLYITEEMYGIKPVVGFQFMPNKYFALGLSAMFGFVLSHDRDVQQFYDPLTGGLYLTETGEGNSSFIRRSSTSFNDSKIPTVVRTGIAWYPSKKLILSADIIGHIGEKNFQNDAEHTINGALGAEYYVTSSFPVRGGIFTNFANTPEISSSKENQEAHVNLFGVTSSFSWETRNSSITLSGMYQSSNYFGWNILGEGEAQVYSNSKAVQKVDMSIYTVSLTGSAKY